MVIDMNKKKMRLLGLKGILLKNHLILLLIKMMLVYLIMVLYFGILIFYVYFKKIHFIFGFGLGVVNFCFIHRCNG